MPRKRIVGQPVRGTTQRRQWEVLFYIATEPRSVLLEQIYKFLEGVVHRKTLLRDLELFVSMGFLTTRKDERSDVKQRYSYIGPIAPFTKQGKLWCSLCRDFKVPLEMKKSKYNIQRVCRECADTVMSKYVKKNRKYIYKRYRKYYAQGRIKRATLWKRKYKRKDEKVKK